MVVEVAREADDQPQPVLRQTQRQLVQRELRLLLDLLQLGGFRLFGALALLRTFSGRSIKRALYCCSFSMTPW